MDLYKELDAIPINSREKQIISMVKELIDKYNHTKDSKIITKESLLKTLHILADQNRFGHPRDRIVLAKYYYPDIDSGIELESCSDNEDCINQLWEVL